MAREEQKRKAEEEKRRKAEATRRQMELEFEQMEIPTNRDTGIVMPKKSKPFKPHQKTRNTRIPTYTG